MGWVKNNWFKLSLLVLGVVFISTLSTFLYRIAWSHAYGQRAECLESNYIRGGTENEKSNCFDIIYQFNK